MLLGGGGEMLVVPLLLPAVSEDEGWQSVSVSSSTQTSGAITSAGGQLRTQHSEDIRSYLNHLFLDIYNHLCIETIEFEQT